MMSDVMEMDTVIQSVRQTVRHYGIISDGTFGQQVLLLGDCFYGYRFTAKEFTAVWSAADQTLKVFDSDGKILGRSLLSVSFDEPVDEESSIRLPAREPLRKAA
ncbi:MAG: hypothetical protein LBN39_09640 [Planctomycetaceae bacterium]|jgi:hypothetical protein|nr:hypothetical protein [Planctomycetaceae bacterium]